MGRWRVLEGVVVADCALEIEGDTLADLFETAARAVVDLMVDPCTVGTDVVRSVSLTAESPDLLLYDWLSELIFLKDSERLVFPRTDVHVQETPCALTARLMGGPLEAATTLRADAKAVTFHMFTLEPRDGRWHARVVIDI